MRRQRHAVADDDLLLGDEVVERTREHVGVTAAEQLVAQLFARHAFGERLCAMMLRQDRDNPRFQIRDDRRRDEDSASAKRSA